MPRPIRILVLALVVLLVPAASATACPSRGKKANPEIRWAFCKTWDKAGDRKLGHARNKVHRWGRGFAWNFAGGSWGDGAILYGNRVDYAFIVAGPYWNTYVSQTNGGAGGPMGYPVGRRTFGGHLRQGPRENTYMTFEGGVINRWAGGTFATWGAILTRWNQSGNVGGSLGRPLSNEGNTHRSPQGHVGRYSRFEHGVINYNPYVNSPKQTFVLFGAILNRYAAIGYASSCLGLPTEDEKDAGGGRWQNFEGGHMFWQPGMASAQESCP